MPALWRVVKRAHAATAFDGKAAERFGGRWNSPGRRAVYASPAYLTAHGTPSVPADLARHACIAFTGVSVSADRWSFTAGRRTVVVPIHPRLVVNLAEPAIDAALAGLGVTRVLSYMVVDAVRDGRLRALGVTSLKRSPLAPDLPAVAETLPGFESNTWFGLYGPKGLPADVVNKLNAQLNEIIRLPDVAAKMKTLGVLPVGGPPETLAKVTAADLERFTRVVKELNIQAD